MQLITGVVYLMAHFQNQTSHLHSLISHSYWSRDRTGYANSFKRHQPFSKSTHGCP